MTITRTFARDGEEVTLGRYKGFAFERKRRLGPDVVLWGIRHPESLYYRTPIAALRDEMERAYSQLPPEALANRTDA